MAAVLKAIAESPYGHGTKPLTHPGRFRAARVGGWRIVDAVDGEAEEILVEVIGPRGQVYRRL